ncbi:hypothetical protein ACWOAH_02835 [Vagococcus vulneris]|uniref:SdpI family protein n=1 Tax=Vagococcus vulneris TaxID=1977869 RepID=A0A430A0U2_9ENTE|nr:hypothetical protein [Vagococcus vulneris]RSU00016.1 hypothetical protein CBF37_01545 [Vagococcus vulneris]
MRGLFGILAVIFLLGSIPKFKPDTPGYDITIFFRKNKKEYNNFANKLRGTFSLISGILFLILFLSSFIFKYSNNETVVTRTFFFVLFVVIFLNVIVEIEWYKKHKK